MTASEWRCEQGVWTAVSPGEYLSHQCKRTARWRSTFTDRTKRDLCTQHMQMWARTGRIVDMVGIR